MVMNDVDLTLANTNFTVRKGPKLGNGAFVVNDSKTVVFKDKNAWTADFDWNLILNGDYSYQVKGDSLILIKNLNADPAANTIYNYYQYRLKRTN